jgi:hypothetical protein
VPVARAELRSVSLWDRSTVPAAAPCPFLSADQPKSMEQWQQIGHHMAWCLTTCRRTVVATLQKGRIRSERRQSRAGRVR